MPLYTLSIIPEHGLWSVRGHNKAGQHVNKAFRHWPAAVKFAGDAFRGTIRDEARYGHKDNTQAGRRR